MCNQHQLVWENGTIHSSILYNKICLELGMEAQWLPSMCEAMGLILSSEEK